MPEAAKPRACKVAVIWIDWYAYHVARFRGLYENPDLHGHVQGIELVGGIGVHQGLKFREELPADLPIETLMPQSSWQEAGQFTLARKLWNALTRIDPEAVLVPGYYTLPALAAAVWARLNRRTSILMTESTAGDHTRVPWKEALKGALIRALFDRAICGGEAHRRYLQQLGFPAEKIASSYDVVDNSYFQKTTSLLRKSAPPPFLPQSPYFLYVGRLSPEKNLEYLLKEWNSYRSLGGKWPLVLVGAGPSESSLQALASKLACSQEIHFMGLKSYHELPAFYAFAGAFVLPSKREPWGLVVNEAMASGLAVIVSSHCGCAETLVEHGGNGLVFNPTQDGALGRALTELSQTPQSQLNEMGNQSLRHIGNYSPETFGVQVISMTNKLLEQRP